MDLRFRESEIAELKHIQSHPKPRAGQCGVFDLRFLVVDEATPIVSILLSRLKTHRKGPLSYLAAVLPTNNTNQQKVLSPLALLHSRRFA